MSPRFDSVKVLLGLCLLLVVVGSAQATCDPCTLSPQCPKFDLDVCLKSRMPQAPKSSEGRVMAETHPWLLSALVVYVLVGLAWHKYSEYVREQSEGHVYTQIDRDVGTIACTLPYEYENEKHTDPEESLTFVKNFIEDVITDPHSDHSTRYLKWRCLILEPSNLTRLSTIVAEANYKAARKRIASFLWSLYGEITQS